MKQNEDVFAKGICAEKALWVFLIGSVFGVVLETIVSYFQFGSFESRRGLIYGPLNPVYGFGALIFMMFLVKYKSPLKVFFGGMLLGGFFEYLCSFFQEKIFGTTSWNYDGYFLNIGGRTSLLLMVCWGAIALLFVFVIYPFISKQIEKMPKKTGKVLSMIILIFLIFDFTISTVACLRQTERSLGLMASNKLEVFLDRHYPDHRLNAIFENAKRQR